MARRTKAQDEALIDALHAVELFPEHHNQASWIDSCGTTMCIAGHGATLAGAKPVKDLWATWGFDQHHMRFKGRVQPVGLIAREAFGLTLAQADTLFHDTSNDELREAVTKILGYEPPPADPAQWTYEPWPAATLAAAGLPE